MAPTPRPNKRKRTEGPATPAEAVTAASDAPAPPAETSASLAINKPDDATAAADAIEQPQERTAEEQEELERVFDLVAEEYHDIISELPLEYQRTFRLLRELEDAQQAHTSDLRTALERYIDSTLEPPTSAPSPAASTSTSAGPPRPSAAALEHFAQLSHLADEAIRKGEDKVGLAIGLYETRSQVDRHIRRLDADLLKYEDSLVIGLRAGTLPSHDAPAATLKSPPGATTSLGAIALGEHEAYEGVGPGDEDARGGRAGRRKSGGAGAAGGVGASAADREKEREWKRRKELQKQERALKKKMQREEGILGGMPIDPNEPTYCYCKRVSFGEMVACENENCPREWFHYECVGLKSAPKGEWYCDDCMVVLNIDPKTMKPATS
ncbi:uncharacterized protein JCM10292_005247 [Rhodotorula paludigena]|uniref:uncharacterized protein n=1 Tax=Rhodotorula paludigena TaxID=86838 RepID=UPI003180683D